VFLLSLRGKKELFERTWESLNQQKKLVFFCLDGVFPPGGTMSSKWLLSFPGIHFLVLQVAIWNLFASHLFQPFSQESGGICSRAKKKAVARFPYKKCFSLSKNSLFTDLSAAGLPAELKHITQRRKRKQPWFPQSAASEEGSDPLPNRASTALSCGKNVTLWLVMGLAKFKSKANPAEHNLSCEYWALEGGSPFRQKPRPH
jgi:hypothetical protein